MRSLAIIIIDFIPDLVWQYALHTILYEYSALHPWVKWMNLKYGGFIAHIYTYLHISTAYE
jgi:hypothetical protein